MARVHGDIRRQRIFAIVDTAEEAVYVGRTCSKNLTRLYSDHLEGKFRHTQDEFGPETQLYVLEIVDCDIAEAHKHVLAWCHYFEKHGYMLIAWQKVFDGCDFLYPDTQAIYDTVCAPTSLENLFTRNVTEPVTSNPKSKIPANKKPTRPPGTTEQLNIRVKTDVAQAFRRFCNNRQCTQSDALAQLLLGSSPYCQITSITEDLAYQKELACYLQEEMMLQKRIAVQQKKKDREIRQAIVCFAAEMARMAHTRFGVHHPDPDAIQPDYYRRVKHKLTQHAYPTQTGCAVITLTDIAYGNLQRHGKIDLSPVLVFGIANGNSIKLRWYPKQDYIGICPNHKAYAIRGSQWLMAYRIANDGAADLIAAVPLVLFEPDPIATEPLSSGPVSAEPTKPALDTQISAARRKHF